MKIMVMLIRFNTETNFLASYHVPTLRYRAHTLKIKLFKEITGSFKYDNIHSTYIHIVTFLT